MSAREWQNAYARIIPLFTDSRVSVSSQRSGTAMPEISPLRQHILLNTCREISCTPSVCGPRWRRCSCELTASSKF
ncbi:hypothetical protein PsYK624_106190 [Phanerochaete sordida]|uniref:Uncharacterized protein n=1 Tax=Phanerochaete sordida TaxID=48140 RepID=A0A9P3LH94_9APHY|nr:hypothetical protein PsYK624_106190 [Phanerochaete sordida]